LNIFEIITRIPNNRLYLERNTDFFSNFVVLLKSSTNLFKRLIDQNFQRFNEEEKENLITFSKDLMVLQVEILSNLLESTSEKISKEKNFQNVKLNKVSEQRKKIIIEGLHKSNGISALIEIIYVNHQIISLPGDSYNFVFSIQEDILYCVKNIILSGIDDTIDRFSESSGMNVLINQLEWPNDIIFEIKDKEWHQL
jgi:hypothetical protein